MISILSVILTEPSYTHDRLLRVLQQYSLAFGGDVDVAEDGSLLLDGEVCEPLRIPVYAGAPEEHKSYRLTEDHIYCLLSHEKPDRVWELGAGVTLDWNELAEKNAAAEVMYITPVGFCWYRYELCDRLPDIPAPEPELLRWQEVSGRVTVTGVRTYCEMLSIPATIRGKPVVQVILSRQPELACLHTLTVPEGVELVDAPWNLETLTRIGLPSSAKLLSPPQGIQTSAWYRNQTGSVYLNNYYCGTRDEPETDMLRVAEGTVGVIDGADAGILWREVIFPESICYLGDNCFGTTPDLPERVHLPYGKIALMNAFVPFWSSGPCLEPKLPTENCWEQRNPLPENFTGRDLYQLFRTSPFVEAVVLPEWEPTVPRLDYSDEHETWTATCLYYREDHQKAGYCVSLAVPSGMPIFIRQKPEGVPYPRRNSVWTKDYETPFYLLGRDYLDACAELIRSGEPHWETRHNSHIQWDLCQRVTMDQGWSGTLYDDWNSEWEVML